MKTRIIYTKFWHDNYISELNIKEKLVFIYLVTNEKVNICGIYELPDKYIKFDLGLKQSELDRIKQKFQKDGKFTFIYGWIKITNFEIYNKFDGEKNKIAKQKEMALIPKKIIEYRYSIDRVSSKTDTLNNHKSIGNYININRGDVKGGLSGKLKYADTVTMFEKEYKKLIDKYGKDNTKKMITVLDNYKDSKGKTYKNDYKAILSWVVDKVLKENKDKKINWNKFMKGEKE